MEFHTISAEEAELLKKQHIKHELLDHRYHLSKLEWLEEKIELLDIKLNGGVGSVPLDAMGSSSPVKGDWIVAAICEQEELEEERRLISKHVETVKKWLAMLSKEQYEAVYCYVIIHNCKDAEECAKILKLRNSKALLRLVDRSVSEIAQKI